MIFHIAAFFREPEPGVARKIIQKLMQIRIVFLCQKSRFPVKLPYGGQIG
jgi:hypothetical protein